MDEPQHIPLTDEQLEEIKNTGNKDVELLLAELDFRNKREMLMEARAAGAISRAPYLTVSYPASRQE